MIEGVAVKRQDVLAGRAGMMTGGEADRGFTLIEVLIAFLIAAMAIGALVRSTTAAVTSTRVAGRYDEAVARAKSHLAALSASPLVESDRQGDEGDGFHWRVKVAAAATAHTARRSVLVSESVVTLYRVSVTVSWSEGGHGRAVQLDSSRLGPVA